MSAPSRKLVVIVTAGLALVLILIGAILWNNTPPAPSYSPAEKQRTAERRAPQPDQGRPTPEPQPGDGSLFQGGGRTVTSLPGGFAPVTSKAGESTAPTAADIPDEERDRALVKIDQVKLMFRDYRTLLGKNPVGTNAEIMKSIIGGNPRGATLGPPEGQTLSGEGELIDQWGTPYFFHQLAATQMEVRSAGPDKKMYTEDDLVQ